MPPPASLAVPESLAAPDRPAPTRGATALVVFAILLVAVNLRPAITSLGALLDEVRTGLHLTGTQAGIVTTIPALSFATFGAITPWLARHASPSKVLTGAMAALAAGQLARAATDSPVVFITTSALALAGIAIGNVLLPGLVKQHFPTRAGLFTGVYTMTLVIGTGTAAALSVPIARAFGSWRAGLAIWALLAAAALLPWLLIRPVPATAPPARADRVRPARTRLGWAMALFFGLQALSGYASMGWLAQIFRDAGYDPATAGLLLAGLAAVGTPIALLMPTIAGRGVNPRLMVHGMTCAMIISYLGLWLAPHTAPMLWVTLLAIGQGAFSLSLAMIGMRSRTTDGTVALSAFTQSAGYLIAALGPLVVGILYEATAGWTMPLAFLIAAAIGQTLAGHAAARERHIEDEPARP